MTNIITVDTGGTFTDVAVYNAENGSVSYGKSLTEYDSLVESVLSSIGKLGVSLDATLLLKHGTTHVINTLIQRTGARTALITTSGFRDMLEIGRGNRPVPFALGYRRDTPLVPRDFRYEVRERINASGEILVPLALSELKVIAEQLRQARVEAVAISFLNSYLNPAHEVAAMQMLRELLPEVYVMCGSTLSREWFEYERTSTAVANAYVGARLGHYIRQFDSRLRERNFTGQLYMMGSNGGVLSVQRTLEQPITLVESGPVGGCIGAAAYAKALNIPKMIAFDMGGTTAKCALVQNGEFDIQPIYYAGGYDYGFPLRIPVLDIVEVGAGGGSIASVDAYGSLSVGPRSAGSEPGPVAFRRGGVEPTVTDANVVLGRIGTGRFLEGSLELDQAAAQQAIREYVAKPLGYDAHTDVDRAAQGILDLATTHMCSAIKEITTERGHDVWDCTLFVFGGGGPLFASSLARSMRISSVVVPPNPGNFCTVGMLLSGARIDLSRTLLIQNITAADDILPRVFRQLEDEARQAMREELGISELVFDRTLEMRYRGQKHTIKVQFTPGGSADDLQRDFVFNYSQQFGQGMPRNPVEIVGVRLGVEAETPRPVLKNLSSFDPSAGRMEPSGFRSIYVSVSAGRIDVPIWDRRTLVEGQIINGPAIIEEFGSTTFLSVGDRATVGEYGELRIFFEN